jgi:hypothetical protein
MCSQRPLWVVSGRSALGESGLSDERLISALGTLQRSTNARLDAAPGD